MAKSRVSSFSIKLRSSWKRFLVIAIALALIVAHSIWSQLKFDTINIWLAAIAFAMLIMPDIGAFLPYARRIKKFKALQFEFELNELEDKVEKAEAENAASSTLKNVPPEVDEVLKEASKDPRAALLLLSSKIESAVPEAFNNAQIDIRKGTGIMRFSSTQHAIEIGIEKGLFPPSALSAYRDFRGIRNRIAHEYTFKVDTDTILSVISIGTELLKVLSAKKSNTEEVPIN